MKCIYCKREGAKSIKGRYSQDIRLCEDCIPKFIVSIDLEELKGQDKGQDRG